VSVPRFRFAFLAPVILVLLASPAAIGLALAPAPRSGAPGGAPDVLLARDGLARELRVAPAVPGRAPGARPTAAVPRAGLAGEARTAAGAPPRPLRLAPLVGAAPERMAAGLAAQAARAARSGPDQAAVSTQERAAAPARRAPTVDDLLDLVQISSAQISPDGTRLLYTRSAIESWKDNKRVSSIWMADLARNETWRFLGDPEDRSPAWSPDGTHVAFLSKRGTGRSAGAGGGSQDEAGPQIWIIRASGGEAWKLTDHKGAIERFEWAPDGARLFFVSADAKSDEEKAAEKAGDDAVFVDEGPNGQDRGRFESLWVVGLADRQERRVLGGNLFISSFSPSPDGSQVAITYRRENTRNGEYLTEVAVVDAATGAMRDLTRNEAPERDVAWSPDGRLVSYKAPSRDTWELAEEKLWAVDAGGGVPRLLSGSHTGTIGRYFWTPDGRTIVFGGQQRGRGGVFALAVADGAVRVIRSGEWGGDLDSATRDRAVVAGVFSTPARPGEAGIVDVASGQLRDVTSSHPQLADLELASVEAVTWKSRDGLEVEGLLWRPAGGAGARLPLLVSVHGGPAGVWSTSFRGINHVYAGLGWAVFEPNVRGSTSYGDRFLQGNLRDIGGGDYEDLMTGIDHLVARGIADPDRLAIRGWSYGGILGGWAITQTPRFKAASVGAMVTDWTSEYAMGFNFDVRRWYIGGTPWDNPEGYRQRSSFTHIANVSTPTIVLHGERDTTCTIGQSMMFYQGLKDRGVPVRFIRFPREPHGFREPHHQRIRDVEEIRWLMKHARGIDWTPPARPLEPESEPKKPAKTPTGP
jgi:dipeptidyl aminopeptidase/acylaminoacyl peptidase